MRFIDSTQGYKETKAYVSNIRNINGNAMINFKRFENIRRVYCGAGLYI